MPSLSKLHIWTAKTKKIPKIFLLIASLFILTRIILTVVAYYSKPTRYAFNIKPFAEYHFTNSAVLNLWGRWDTNAYIQISQRGYSSIKNSEGRANYAFFPLYPIFMRVFLRVFAGNYYLSALFLSNFFFILAAYLLYKTARLDTDESQALRTVKYLFLLPVSFLFSSALTESMFLFLLLATFYFARRAMWLQSGLCGLLLSLTRPLGVLAFIPLLAEFLDTTDQKQALTTRIKSFIWLLLVPLGFILFAYYVYRLTGDPLSIVSIQSSWNRNFLVSPIFLLAQTIFFLNFKNIFDAFASTYAFILLLIIITHFKSLRPSYWILSTLLLIVPLMTGLQSILRLTLPIFPIYLMLAGLTKKHWIDESLTIVLAMLQGALMIAWVAGSVLTI